MDISSLYNVSSGVIQNAIKDNTYDTSIAGAGNTDVFASFLDSAVKSLNSTNAYISDAEDEQMRLALGETENTHDLTIALQKASTALQYTVAVRDKFLESYRTIMNMQI
ncbi:MAG: flagellar hook-basal body complex protein FliE [Lachnospiraceae bacterium]|nr:flagellar hook-basal body complex protein FliE [Lachnospiraceae bacterium]